MSIGIVAFYAGINGSIALVLSLLVIRLRMKTRTGLGTGGHPELERAIRVHGNFVEYVPLILLLLLIDAWLGIAPLWLHVLGIALTVARLAHAWGISHNPGTSVGRFIGINVTLLTLLAAAVIAVVRGFCAW